MTTPTLAMLALLAAPAADEPHPGITPKLTEVTDHRVIQLTDEDAGFGFHEPGLRLLFDLNLRDGYHFAAFDQEHATITATDSRGTDLTATDEGTFGRRDYFEPIGTWGEYGMVYDSFTIKLAQPTRASETFTLNATIPAIVYAGTEVQTLRVNDRPSELSPSSFGSNASIVLRRANGTTYVTIKPGTLEDSIEKIELLPADGDPVNTISTMWSDDSVEYMFQSDLDGPATIRITSRTNLHTVPVRIQIKDMRLP